MQSIRKILGWTAVAALVLFVILNHQPITVNFWWGLQITAPIAFVVIGSAAMGAVAMYMFKASRAAKDKK